MLTRFWDISEIENGYLKDEFKVFWELNNLIETQKLTREQVEEAYVKVMCWEEEINNKLHQQIKYLLDNVKVAVNSILEFYDFKVMSYLQGSIKLISEIEKIHFSQRDWIINNLSQPKSKSIEFFLIAEFWERKGKEFAINKKTMSDEEIYEIIKQFISIVNDNNCYIAWAGLPV